MRVRLESIDEDLRFSGEILGGSPRIYCNSETKHHLDLFAARDPSGAMTRIGDDRWRRYYSWASLLELYGPLIINEYLAFGNVVITRFFRKEGEDVEAWIERSMRPACLILETVNG